MPQASSLGLVCTWRAPSTVLNIEKIILSNFRLKDPEAVFIHIPKTGGTSIRMGLWGRNYDGPIFGEIPPEWEGLFKFAFVRHPLDRLVSAWKMFADGTFMKSSDYSLAAAGRAVGLRGVWDRKLKEQPKVLRVNAEAPTRSNYNSRIDGISLKEFLSIVVDDSIPYAPKIGKIFPSAEVNVRHHAIPQTHSFNCLHKADFVGRFERFDEDCAVITAKLNMANTLPHMRRTLRGGWKEYLDGDDIELCREFYREDFERLGYEI
jgi:hypothetical protein